MSQYFLPTVTQTNFSDTKNVLTKKHQSNIQNYDDCLRVSKTLKTNKKHQKKWHVFLIKCGRKNLNVKKQDQFRLLILYLNETFPKTGAYVKLSRYREKSVHSKPYVENIVKNIE